MNRSYYNFVDIIFARLPLAKIILKFKGTPIWSFVKKLSKFLYKRLMTLHEVFSKLTKKYRRIRITIMNKNLLRHSTLIEVSCYCCGKKDEEVISFKNGLRIVKCKNCGLVYVNPRLSDEDYKKVYDKHYWFERQKGGDQKSLPERKDMNLKAALQDKIKFIQRFKGEGSLLDIGCSDGALVEAAGRNGYRAMGIEINLELVKYAKKIYHKRKFLYGNLKELKLEQNTFDVVSLFDVIEHYLDPIEELREIYRIMKREGILIIDTITTDDPVFQSNPSGWTHMRPFQHIYLFNKALIRRLVEKMNFKILCIGKPNERYALKDRIRVAAKK